MKCVERISKRCKIETEDRKPKSRGWRGKIWEKEDAFIGANEADSSMLLHLLEMETLRKKKWKIKSEYLDKQVP